MHLCNDLSYVSTLCCVFDVITAIFKAEGISASLNRKLNDHVSSIHLLKAQSALAENERVSSGFALHHFEYQFLFIIMISKHISCTLQLVIVGTQGGKAANSLLQADAALSSVPEDYENTSRESILTEMAIASGRGDVRIMMGLPFSNAPTRKGTQSLPDKRTLDRQRVHAIMSERKANN